MTLSWQDGWVGEGVQVMADPFDVMVREPRSGRCLQLAPDVWQEFIDRVKRGEFDSPQEQAA